MNQLLTSSFKPISLLVLASAMLVACGGGGGGGGGGINPPPPPPPPPPPAFGANFSEIQANVFTSTCATAGCHTGAGAPEGLRLDETNSYGLLVGVASNQNPAILRVAPSDPDNSYLIMKLEGNAGVQMPFGGTPLAQSTIDIIRQWITDGAIDDRAQATDPIRVTSLSPVPDAVLNAAPTQIVAIFDRDPDASTVNANTFTLESSGGDTTFGDGNEAAVVAASVSVPMANPGTAVFDINGVLADETYQVTLSGSGAAMILDQDANALDGEFGGAFPSGDGTEGGNFVAQFSIVTPPPAGQTLDEIQAAVFGPTCSTGGCHSGGGVELPTSMDLTSADASFASLVNTASVDVPALLRVDPDDPDDSYLIRKLEGTQSIGVRMPAVGPALDQAVIDDIRAWITNGAQR